MNAWEMTEAERLACGDRNRAEGDAIFVWATIVVAILSFAAIVAFKVL